VRRCALAHYLFNHCSGFELLKVIVRRLGDGTASNHSYAVESCKRTSGSATPAQCNLHVVEKWAKAEGTIGERREKESGQSVTALTFNLSPLLRP
jgi:hypothetical protein